MSPELIAGAIANGSHPRGRSGVAKDIANPIANGSRMLSHAGSPVAVAVAVTTTLSLAVVCGVRGSDQIQSNGYLPSPAAPIGFGGKP